jgi:hypothetical protein
MIAFDQARQMAHQAAQARAGVPISIRDDLTIEKQFGWVFFWWAAAPRAEGSRILVGASPIIVDRFSGRCRGTGSAYPASWFVDAYETLGEERFDAGEWREYILRKYAAEFGG